MTVRPPRFFEWLFAAFLPSTVRDDVLGDLEERFQARTDTSAAAARWWYRRQVIVGVPRLAWGGVAGRIREQREDLGAIWHHGLFAWSDVRHALGIVVREPFVTTIAVVVLALGVASTTTMFGIAHGLTRPLPIDNPDAFVRIARHAVDGGRRYTGMDAEDYRIVRSRQTRLEDVAATLSLGFQLSSEGVQPQRVSGVKIAPQGFDLLRVDASMGRTLDEEDAVPGASPVVVLSYRLWQSRYGGDDPIGQEVRVNDQLRTVVGIMPPDFGFPLRAQLWIPLTLDGPEGASAGDRLDVFCRLREDVTIEEAGTEIAGLGERISLARPEVDMRAALTVEPFMTRYVPTEDLVLINLMVLMATAVLVIAATNVANVLLSRAVTRTKETAVRMALGGSRTRVLSLRLLECLTLAALGGGAGLVLSLLLISWFDRALGADMNMWWMDVRLDGTVFSFAVMCVVGATIVAGLLPALQSSAVDLKTAMRSESAGSTSFRQGRVSRFLVGGQLMLSCTLLILCGMIVLGARNLDRWEYAFGPERVLTGRVYLESFDYPDNDSRVELRRTLRESLNTVAGIEEVAFTTALPGGQQAYQYSVEGDGQADSRALPTVEARFVSPEFFGMFEMARVEGRLFGTGDRDRSDRLAVVNERFARRLGGDASALGQRIRLGRASGEDGWVRVIGVVEDPGVIVREGKGAEGVFLPSWDSRSAATMLAIRVRSSSPALTDVLETIHAIDPNLPFSEAALLSDVLLAENRPERVFALIFGSFGLIALALAVVGLYGVVAFSVSQRVREIGVRRAVGARSREIHWWTVRSGLVPLLFGLGAGVAVAWMLAPSMGELLFGTDPRNPYMFTAVPMILLAAAGLGLWFPARRAVRVDPMSVLRTE